MQHLGLVSMAIYWGSIVYILRRWGIRSGLTFSDHVAQGPVRKVYVPATFITVVLFGIYLLAWLLPHYDVPLAAYVLLASGLVLEAITAVIPRLQPHADLHDVLAVLAGISMGLALLLFLYSPRMTGGLSIWLAATAAVKVIIGLVLLNRHKKHYLYYQFAFHGLFTIWIVGLAYVQN